MDVIFALVLATATPGGGFPVFGDAFAEVLNAQEPALRINLSELSIIVCPIEKLPDRRVARSLRLELFFDCHPFGHGIQPRALACQAGHIKLGAIVLVDVSAVCGRQLDPPLVVHPDCIIPSEHPIVGPITALLACSTLLHSVPP